MRLSAPPISSSLTRRESRSLGFSPRFCPFWGIGTAKSSPQRGRRNPAVGGAQAKPTVKEAQRQNRVSGGRNHGDFSSNASHTSPARKEGNHAASDSGESTFGCHHCPTCPTSPNRPTKCIPRNLPLARQDVICLPQGHIPQDTFSWSCISGCMRIPCRWAYRDCSLGQAET